MSERYVDANGLRIFCAEEGEGPLVLMLHGFPEFHYSWRHQMAPIASAGFRAVAIDLPGYGRSDKPDARYDSAFVGDCIDGVIAGLGYDDAVLIGHDWGAFVMWPFARTHPERVRALVGLNVPDLPRYDIPPTELFKALGSNKVQYILEFQDRSIEERIEKDVRGFLELFLRGPAAVHKEVFTDDILDAYVEQFSSPGAFTGPLDYYRNMDRNWELAAAFADKKIEVPVLMISADGDPVLPPALTDGMEERTPDLEKVVIEDCGHWTQQEQPDVTTEHIVRFLRRIS